MNRSLTNVLVAGIVLSNCALAQVTERVSVYTSGAEAPHGGDNPTISADGRFVLFQSADPGYAPGAPADTTEVFVHDRFTGNVTLVSADSMGTPGNANSYADSISADGRFVAFESYASNLVPGDVNGRKDVFVHDRQTGATTLVSVSTSGNLGNFDSADASISADGRFVAFASIANTLVPGDTNAWWDVFVRDSSLGTTERISVSSSGAQGNGSSSGSSISADGRFIAFHSLASNLVTGDSNGAFDIFVHDMATGATTRVSVDSSGSEADADSTSPTISADGRVVAFLSDATNLVASDMNGVSDVFAHDLTTGMTRRASVDSNGVEGNGECTGFVSPWRCGISADGRFVSFPSAATNLVNGDTNGKFDIFVHDFVTARTTRVSLNTDGGQAVDVSFLSSLSADGRFVSFYSLAPNLVSDDTNFNWDCFVRDTKPTGFESLCSPSVDGVAACPCSNPPSSAGRGCDNSSSTGGGALSASGAAYLSMDGLVFTTSGEKPTATSIVMQGDAPIASGAVFGQGVRCVGGALKRLYTKTAIGGSITAPEIGAGDPTVSARSTALGDTISSGQSRWYLVYYRDPLVLGGCPVGSTFNATQTGRIDWSL